MSKKFMEILHEHYEDENENTTSWFWTLFPLIALVVGLILILFLR